MNIVSTADWNSFLQSYPDAHLLQTGAWGEFKGRFGWKAARVIAGHSGAQILFRPLPGGFSFAYIAKGPVGPDWQTLWPAVHRACRAHRAVMLQVEPDAWEPGTTNAAAELRSRFPGFRGGVDPIQPRRTIVISLDGTEDDLLARMKQKTRYNIRLAEKKEVVVRESRSVDDFFTLMQSTGQRDGFGVHSKEYFQQVYSLFEPLGMCVLLMAEYAGHPLAGLMAFARGSRAWYFYGASNDEERNRMPAYLLQWEAMRWAKARGCSEYDLWGVPDASEADLEAGFSERSDGLWGVYRFKRGFGGELMRSAGAWEKAYLPLVSPLYHWWSARRHEAG